MAAKAQVTTRKVDTKTAPKSAPGEEEIRRRAYEIYLQRGGEPGSEIDDWIQAEQELGMQLQALNEKG